MQVIGIIEQDLADADFIQNPRKKSTLTTDFISPPALNKMKRLVKKRNEEDKKGDQTPQKLESMGTDEQGRKQYKIPDAPKALEQEQGSEKKKKVKAFLLCKTSPSFARHAAHLEA